MTDSFEKFCVICVFRGTVSCAVVVIDSSVVVVASVVRKSNGWRVRER